MNGVPAYLNAAASTSTDVAIVKSPGSFFLLPPPWQNLFAFPTARNSHADSYIAVIHYYINVRFLLSSER
jgi:hypothetical protein